MVAAGNRTVICGLAPWHTARLTRSCHVGKVTLRMPTVSAQVLVRGVPVSAEERHTGNGRGERGAQSRVRDEDLQPKAADRTFGP